MHLSFTSKISEKEVNTCLCCEKLSLELNKTKLKLYSYEEIIKLLQEERSDEGSCSQWNLIKQNYYSNNERSLFSPSEISWINFTSNLCNKSRIIHSNPTKLIPQSANKFEISTNLNKESESSSASVVQDIASCSRNFKEKKESVNSSTRKSHKIIMIGDSHVRNCATEFQHNLGVNYEVFSFV